MMGEDQEHFADYLELEHYIEDLQAEQTAHLPPNLTPEQAQVYRMAMLFHATSPEVSKASQPQPDFIADLQERLLAISQEVESPTQEERSAQTHQTDQAEDKNQQEQVSIQPPRPEAKASDPSEEQPRKAGFVSRRGLLAGGAAAAASLAVGIGAGTMLNKGKSEPAPPAAYKQEDLIPNGPTTWQFVAPLAQLSGQAIKFVTDAITGYIMLSDEATEDTHNSHNASVIALSAACTHMGCIVNWEDKHHHFQCPCHGGLFDEYGLPAKESPLRYLKPLPCLRTKIENGNVYVEVPASSSSPTKKSI
jgi:Rieske Fe-S protein